MCDSILRHTVHHYPDTTSGDGGSEDLEEEEEKSKFTKWRNIIGFFIIGVANNYPYAIMFSAAFDIIHRLSGHSETLTDFDYLDPCTLYNGSYIGSCLLYTSPSPRDATLSRMPSSA